MQTQNQYLDYLIDPSFQGVNRLFVLPFEVDVVWTGHLRYFLPTVELKDYNIMIDGRNILISQLKNDVDPKAIQQINFTGSVERAGNSNIVFYSWKSKRNHMNFLEGTARVL